MTTEATRDGSGYWYGDGATGVDVLNALRRYRAAETAANRRARESLGVGENALASLRYLLERGERRQPVNARDLAAHLGITAASTSALVDRLVRSGHIERRDDPNDRRGVLLSATGPAMVRTVAVLDALDGGTRDAIEDLDPEQMRVVAAFLDGMADVVGEIDDALDEKVS